MLGVSDTSDPAEGSWAYQTVISLERRLGVSGFSVG